MDNRSYRTNRTYFLDPIGPIPPIDPIFSHFAFLSEAGVGNRVPERTRFRPSPPYASLDATGTDASGMGRASAGSMRKSRAMTVPVAMIRDETKAMVSSLWS